MCHRASLLLFGMDGGGRAYLSAGMRAVFSQKYPSIRLQTKTPLAPTLQFRKMSSGTRKRKSPPGKTLAAAPVKRKVQSTTTQAGVSNFFKPSSQKEPEKLTWRLVAKTLLVGKYSNKAADGNNSAPSDTIKQIAGFDLDSTLITTKSGNKFAKSTDDWQWWHASVPAKLKELYNTGYTIVIFTNQGGIPDPTKDSQRLKTFKSKVAEIFTVLNIPEITVYSATANDKYRKPRPGMWEECLDDFDLDAHGGMGLDLSGSYLVGDAAGRQGDFSDTDRNWALNIGLGFHTPEEFFLGELSKAMTHKFNPSQYTTTVATITATTGTVFTKTTAEKEVILFVGSPGAGKSTFYWRHLKPLGYERVNQDVLKTKPKCFAAAGEWLKNGKSVAIDNTNADLSTRQAWITFARQYKAPIRCLYFTSPEELCMHNSAVRAFGGDVVNPEGRDMLPGIAFRSFKGRFEEPVESEGFAGLIKVEFKWEGGDEERKIWSKFWT